MAQQAAHLRYPLITNRSVMETAVGLAPYISRIACGGVEHGLMTPNHFGDEGVIDAIAIYCKGNWLRDNIHNVNGYGALMERELLCAEYGSVANASTRERCREWFLRGIRYYILCSDDATALDVPAEPVGVVDIANEQEVFDFIENIELAYGRRLAGVTRFPVTFEQAYDYAIVEGARRRDAGHNLNLTAIVVTALIAIIKRGNVTPEAIEKVEQACRDQIGKVIAIQHELVNRHYTLYTPAMSPVNIRGIVVRLLDIIPAAAIKLRTMVEQCAYSGLSTYVMIREAIAKYADFEWGVVEVLYPGQFRAYHDAVTTIAGNKYFAFRHGSMGNAASTKYAILGWTARSLLIESGDQPELKKYGGRYNRKKYPRIEPVITAYVHRPLAVDDEGGIVEPNHAFWANCRNYINEARNWIIASENHVEENGPPVGPLMWNGLGDAPAAPLA